MSKDKEMSLGDYFSYLSNKDYEMFDEMVRPRVETWPSEWMECFLCYDDGSDPRRCYTDFEPNTFCTDRVRIE